MSSYGIACEEFAINKNNFDWKCKGYDCLLCAALSFSNAKKLAIKNAKKLAIKNAKKLAIKTEFENIRENIDDYFSELIDKSVKELKLE